MNINVVKSKILSDNNITESNVFSIISDLSFKKINYSDIYFQIKESEFWILEDSVIKNSGYHISEGIGIRIINHDRVGFSYTNEINFKKLKNISKKLIINFKKCSLKKTKIIKSCILETKKKFYGMENPLNNISNKEKLEILKIIDKTSRSYNSKISKVRAKLFGSYEYILILSTDGIFKFDIRPLIKVSIEVLAEYNGKREVGISGGGFRNSYDYLLFKKKSNISLLKNWSKEACRIAILNLFSKKAPSGLYPVILGSGWPGVLLHEAVGHGLEGDFNRKKLSNFSSKIGHKVASKLCTIVDNGSLKNSVGSLNIDDEGYPGSKNILIKKGILKKYMQDKFNSILMNVNATGNGRRESYAHLPLPRMTNTYMLSGNSKVQDIFDSVDYGIYAVNFIGGQVDIVTGEFVFSTLEAYLIKKGIIMYPIKKVTLIGSGIKVMKSISMIGNDLKMDEGSGICVKDNQSIPVCVGQPTIKIDFLTVGGG